MLRKRTILEDERQNVTAVLVDVSRNVYPLEEQRRPAPIVNKGVLMAEAGTERANLGFKDRPKDPSIFMENAVWSDSGCRKTSDERHEVG
ncbi:unnamed protein product [Microthlaspi erraticum]|uniref:Uncharacterized protein n=1 Tax=Microthlaspi erraticum TaxID=1685480 RepID=A0A6D2K1H3_9BRAS|nr:unnamed protein product [Microthlaspi erraticum]CAA7050317.1 unnamed protein product [Microthlaspi erraticum]